jgi:AcrR family transcriptional regulator
MKSNDDTECRLLQAAGELFAEKGFDGTSVREICQKAGAANVAAVNYYFRDKEHLYIEAVKSACSRGDENFPYPDWPAGTPPHQKLRDFIRILTDRMFGNSPPWARRLFLRDLLASILTELLPKVPPRKRSLIAFSIVGQCFFHRFAQPIVTQLVGEEEARNYDTALLAEHIADFSLAALGIAPGKKGRATRSRAASRTRE